MNRFVPAAVFAGRSKPAPPAEPVAVAEPAGSALDCLHAARPCPALVGLIGNSGSVSAEARDWVRRLQPCASCRVAMEAKRRQLSGLRLGKRERDVLLGASRQEAYVVTAPGLSRAASAALRRAARTLRQAGLVEPAAGTLESPGTGRATVSLTPFGRYMMAAFGRFLERGTAVRWTRAKTGVAIPGREPEALVSEALALTREELARTLDELKRVLIAAIGRPVRDPARLETLTRHLQSKAQGLRDLLEQDRALADHAPAQQKAG